MQNETSNKQSSKKKAMLGAIIIYALFIGISFLLHFDSGIQMSKNFVFFAVDMLKLLPAAFILVGLFMVWVKRETVEKYLGTSSGLLGHLTAILLACTTLFPFVVVMPMAHALAKKGARLSIVLTYLGATAVCRIPMTIFEASFLGLKFSIIRYIVSLPLIILASILIEKWVGKDYMEKSDLLIDIE